MKIAMLTLFLMLSPDNGPLPQPEAAPQEIPDFAGYTNVRQKKSDFFQFMLPNIRSGNAQILAQRQRLTEILQKLKNHVVLNGADTQTAMAS